LSARRRITASASSIAARTVPAQGAQALSPAEIGLLQEVTGGKLAALEPDELAR
jgi:hypothetical protein